MHSVSKVLALAASLNTVSAAVQGLNYGSVDSNNAAYTQSDFETMFKTAANLAGTNNAFTSARLYTMIQGSTTSDVIQAIPAAIATNTTLLLGLWASGTGFANEITALKSAISTYGSQLEPLVVGISVGSEDLYRNTALSQENDGGVGQAPATLVQYISEVRSTISGTALSGASIGHVDTWDAWTNGTNTDVISAIDWLGVDEYPYWQTTDGNDVSNGAALFDKAYDATQSVAQGKEIWVTETGWAVSGPTEGEGVAGTSEAKTYWDNVGCALLFGKTNTWWYTLSETGASPDFSLSDSVSNTTPLYDLSCAAVNTTSSVNSTSTSTGSSSGSTGTSGSSGSGSSGSSGSGSSSGSSGSSGSGASGSGSNTTVVGTNATATGGASKTSSGSSGSASSTGITDSGAASTTASFSALLITAALAVFAL